MTSPGRYMLRSMMQVLVRHAGHDMAKGIQKLKVNTIETGPPSAEATALVRLPHSSEKSVEPVLAEQSKNCLRRWGISPGECWGYIDREVDPINLYQSQPYLNSVTFQRRVRTMRTMMTTRVRWGVGRAMAHCFVPTAGYEVDVQKPCPAPLQRL